MNGILTKEQQELVSLNHDLIYDFAKKRNLSIEEYYDILAIGLCKSAIVFDEKKGKFSTVAFRCMKNELCNYWMHMQRKSYIPDNIILSYDAPISWNSDDNCSFLDKFTDNNYTCDIVIDNIMSDNMFNTLTPREKKIVKYLNEGLEQKDIANILGCSKQNISYCVKQIRKKWKAYLANN